MAQVATARRDYPGLILLVVAAAVAIATSAFLLSEDPPAPLVAPPASGDAPGVGMLETRRPEFGEPAPDFALADARDPSQVRRLSEFRGQAVILNWYASWCGPCKDEIPEFQAAQDALGGQLVVLGVDYMEPPEKATGILAALGATYPAVLDVSGAVADHYRIGNGLPVTFFINADGVLIGRKTGRVTASDLEKFLAEAGVAYTAPAR